MNGNRWTDRIRSSQVRVREKRMKYYNQWRRNGSILHLMCTSNKLKVREESILVGIASEIVVK